MDSTGTPRRAQTDPDGAGVARGANGRESNRMGTPGRVDPRAFGPRLRELRRAAGHTQRALASAAGVHWTSVARVERAAMEPSWSLALKLAKALGVGVDAFTDPNSRS